MKLQDFINNIFTSKKDNQEEAKQKIKEEEEKRRNTEKIAIGLNMRIDALEEALAELALQQGGTK